MNDVAVWSIISALLGFGAGLLVTRGHLDSARSKLELAKAHDENMERRFAEMQTIVRRFDRVEKSMGDALASAQEKQREITKLVEKMS